MEKLSNSQRTFLYLGVFYIMVSYKFNFNGSASNARELIQAFLSDEYIIDNGIKGDAPAGDLEKIVFCYPSRKIKKDLFFSKAR